MKKRTWKVVGTMVVALAALGVRGASAATIADLVNVVHVPRGGKIILPVEGVSRAVSDPEDIARLSFDDQHHVVLEGITNGSTKVELEQGTLAHRTITVQVQDAGTVPANAPLLVAAPAAAPVNTDPAAITPMTTAPTPSNGSQLSSQAAAPSNLAISLRVAPVEDNPLQALFTISFENRGTAPAQNVKVRYALDDQVAYVTGSATKGARYDATARELVWSVGSLPASATDRAEFRVEPIDNKQTTFYSVATIEDASTVATSSNTIKYTTNAPSLMTVFAFPDRILAGRNAPVLVDVKGAEFQEAVDYIQKMGVAQGRGPGQFEPDAPTQRVEYAVMTLNGMNLRDLRDLSAIKFVVGRRSTVSLEVLNSRGQSVATLVKPQVLDPGERTVFWDGRSGTGYVPAGRYTYVCVAKDARGESTTLKGYITVVPQSPIEAVGRPSFVDVKPRDWYASYLAVAEKQNLVTGYPDHTFKPEKFINREEATAIMVRALGLEDMARSLQKQDVGFLDYNKISPWAVGYVNAASTRIKTINGRTMVRGNAANFFEPQKNLARGEAAILVQRLINRETNRQFHVSGQMAPGATITINSHAIQAADDGRFELVFEQSTATPITMIIMDRRMR